MASSAMRSVEGNTRPLALSQLPTALRLTPSALARSACDIPALTRAVRIRVLSLIDGSRYPPGAPLRSAAKPGDSNAVWSVILASLVHLRCQNSPSHWCIDTYFDDVSNTDRQDRS